MKAHRVALLALGGWAYALAAAGASHERLPVAAFVLAAASLTCCGLLLVAWRAK